MEHNLNEKIDYLKKDLKKLYEDKKDLQDPDLIHKSVELDHLIIKAQKQLPTRN